MSATPLQVTAQLHSTGMTVRVRNQSEVPLEAAAVVYQGRLFSLGTLAPGEELFEDLYTTLQPTESQYETTWQALFRQRPEASHTREAYLQEVLLQHHFGESHLSEASKVPFLAGWMVTPAMLSSSPEALAVRGMTFIVSRLAADESQLRSDQSQFTPRKR
jgi:hypothetical protein